MLRSMTGFGSATRELGGTALGVEVRAVNHRHLLVKTRIGVEDPALDAEVEAAVRRRLDRGSVSVHLNLQRAAAETRATIDADLARSYRDELRSLADGLGVPGEVSLQTLLALPGVVGGGREDPGLSGGLRRALLGALGAALDGLVRMRELEGSAIAADLEKHLHQVRTATARIERRMPQVVRAHQKEVARRVGELLGDSTAVPRAELAREIAVLADRLDVSEEVSRLASHTEQLGALIRKGGRVGRKLDFLVQELLREVNTIGSKCNDAKVAHWVVELKTYVERMREQVQNVE